MKQFFINFFGILIIFISLLIVMFSLTIPLVAVICTGNFYWLISYLILIPFYCSLLITYSDKP